MPAVAQRSEDYGNKMEDKVMDGGMEGIKSVERAGEEPAKTGPESAGPPRDLLDRETLKKHIAGRSDEEGLKQVLFHALCVCICAYFVKTSFNVPKDISSGGCTSCSWAQFILAELAFGVVASFYFNAFHESIHGTAFRSKWMNSALCYFLGFLTFRGARWYWYFHWAHHRFTNDPKLDPELEGNTVDRADPLANPNKMQAMFAYARFLSGYPFGSERLPGIFKHAIGGKYTPVETFVKTDKARASVRLEYRVWVFLYAVLVTLTATDFLGLGGMGGYNVGAKLWYYWLLPHAIGAAHLRYYQTAEHRSCTRSSYTGDDNNEYFDEMMIENDEMMK